MPFFSIKQYKFISYVALLTLTSLTLALNPSPTSAIGIGSETRAEDDSWVCRGRRPRSAEDLIHKDENIFADYGFFVENNDKIDLAYKFHVFPANYFLPSPGSSIPGLRPTLGLRTFVLNSQGQFLCMLEGGPMIRSKSSLTEGEHADPSLFAMMSMSFVMKTQNYFSHSRDRSGPHIPVVLLGSLHTTVASEGIGPIFGNQSAWKGNFTDPDPALRDDPACVAPNPDSEGNGKLGNFSVIESFRNKKVCLFGSETSSTEQFEDDRDYKVEIWARPISMTGKTTNTQSMSGIHNKIRYRVTRLARNELERDQLIVDKTVIDTAEVFDQHGGWLIFNVIGPVVRPFQYDFELKNLKVNYPDQTDLGNEMLPQN